MHWHVREPAERTRLAKNSQHPTTEQRHTTRRAAIMFAWYKRIDDAAADEEEGVAHSCDVSKDGIGIVTTRKLPEKARLFLELIAEGGRISALGRVVHGATLPNGQFRTGIRIEIVPPSCKLIWQQLTEP